jgi:hypothetical protein
MNYLHDGLEFDVPVGALPPGNQMQHMHALGCLPFRLTLGTRKLNAEQSEHGYVGHPVPHFHEPRVKVDLTRQCADGQQGGIPHDQEWGHGLVEEARVNVRCLFQNNDVPPRALRRRNLRERWG